MLWVIGPPAVYTLMIQYGAVSIQSTSNCCEDLNEQLVGKSVDWGYPQGSHAGMTTRPHQALAIEKVVSRKWDRDRRPKSCHRQ